MNKKFVKYSLGWGLGLWAIGYILGFVLFFAVPASMIGWVITPIGFAVTLWVLFKKVKGDSFKYYFKLAVVWTLVAVIFDYIFIVKMLKPVGGYYKLDVYLYYALTFALPLAVGWKKTALKK